MAFNSFLKIDGVPGESLDKGHPQEIEISSFSWGVSNSSSGGGGGGRPSLQDFHFSMATSKASPPLMVYCATGHRFEFATLTCRRPGGRDPFEFLKIKLSDCVVSEYDIGSHVTDTDYSLLAGPENSAVDRLSISFHRIEFQYTVERTREIVSSSFETSGPL